MNTDLTRPWRTSSHSANNGACVQAASRWRTSSSSAANGNCAEVASLDSMVLVRDSALDASPVLAFTPAAWLAFTASLKG